jgi:hypothetical protein
MTTAPTHLTNRDSATEGAMAGRGERAVPYHCPYCAGEDLRPLGASPGAWHCRACTRTFSVKYLGMAPLTPTCPPTPDAVPAPTPTRGAGEALTSPPTPTPPPPSSGATR